MLLIPSEDGIKSPEVPSEILSTPVGEGKELEGHW